jgi:hypothetical protein
MSVLNEMILEPPFLSLPLSVTLTLCHLDWIKPSLVFNSAFLKHSMYSFVYSFKM